MADPNGKIIAITGAARGIGLATATALQAAGAKVAIGDIDEPTAKRAAETLSAPALPVDVTDRESFTAFLDGVETELGPVDVLVNNAGIMPIGPLLEEDDVLADRCIDINVRGVILGTKLGLARMVPRGQGHIINIASVAGVMPAAGMATYNASKHAVVGFTEAVRLEFARQGIEVSAVMPTFTNTELIAGTKSARGQRNAEPEEVAAAVLGLIAKPRPQVIVPAKLGRQLRLGPLMSRGMRDRMARWYGLDEIFLNPDKEARKAYDERMRG
ncbi:SDR family oxidoreductase [Actinomadura sp. HBU206391]|uniref:SDR family oxidoreductase n=1 Tax=Actinomadura sp. HBU206391 TaxID=2731692 RepID=UPI001650CBAC|nr:SDR family oxidoreductase [Actinomadura sp. HBU206391]MBC6459428.1 SDR family oxidoreductase [Actinomadura sp. HBU206391]